MSKTIKMIESTELEAIFNEMDTELEKTSCEVCENLQYILAETDSLDDRRLLQDKLDQHYEIMKENLQRIKNPYKRLISILIGLNSIQLPDEFKEKNPKIENHCPSLQIFHIIYEMVTPEGNKVISKPYYYTATCYFGANEIASSIKDFLDLPELKKKINKDYEFLFFCNSDIGINSKTVMAIIMSQLEGIKYRWEACLPKHSVFPNGIIFKNDILSFLPKTKPRTPLDVVNLLKESGTVRIVGVDFTVYNYKKLEDYINPDLDVGRPQYIEKKSRKDNLLYLRTFNRECEIYDFYTDGMMEIENLFGESDIVVTKSNLQPNLTLMREIINHENLWMDEWYKIFVPERKMVQITDKTKEIMEYFKEIRKRLNESQENGN